MSKHTREAWVRFADDGSAVHTVVDVDVEADTVTVDRQAWNSLAGRLGMSQTKRLPDEPEEVDPEALANVTPIPEGNQPLGAPNRVEGDADGMGPGKDPGDFKAKEVTAYLDGLADDAEGNAERDRVIAAEKDGQARVSIIGSER